MLRGVDPPHSPAVPSGFDAFDVFAGYMVLDAWIANRAPACAGIVGALPYVRR